ncbi:hypothetical protein A1O1_01467 [Capronia coronata CBS 617.96]|uniref:mitogen-activated protein kinase n=1 Tax=Capronia coronata CBS 617.96 TaxID=1182541 RepID=W9Z447_9EURO|nr:uncharacterized protein A1O1_01467 [Capronia coronata CBS 617.96]EXJ96341.1 hypothetical protein A1O1_01467 [Capronia coronata CBS 617.96]
MPAVQTLARSKALEMPRSQPHPLALFSLEPVNDRAREVIAHPINQDFVSVLKNGSLALDIGHIRSKSGPTTLTTLGCGDADIFVPNGSISKIQCSFELDLDNKVVMLYDRSHSQSTQVSGENATPFEQGRVRKIVVREGLNTRLGMGGERRNLVQFKFNWHPGAGMDKVNDLVRTSLAYEEDPRFARTIDEADTVLPTRRETRLHTPGIRRFAVRYVKVDFLGTGQFGEVHKSIDVDSGRLMAVKILKPPANAQKQQLEHWDQSVHSALKREVANLANISHPHIVGYIVSQGWDGPVLEIFMTLNEDTLESLIESGARGRVAESAFHQMLKRWIVWL